MNRYLNPTGGLIYHWRAWRYSRVLWAPFRAEIAQWLADWKPSRRALLIVGPSAGYTLEQPFLDRFDRISAIEPDPVARFLFDRRFRRIEWDSTDYFSPRGSGFEIDGMKRLLARYENHAILFSNFLGQLPFLGSAVDVESSLARWCADLDEILRDREWATYHDRASGSAEPRIREGVLFSADEFYPQTSKVLELVDHLTGNLFPTHPRKYFSWQIFPGYWHLIEGIKSR